MRGPEAELGIPKPTASEILRQDPGMKRLANFILRLLLLENKEHRAAVANDLIQTATNEPHFLRKVTTGGESWVCAVIQKGRPSRPNASCLVLHA